jgi:hypothetical protein
VRQREIGVRHRRPDHGAGLPLVLGIGVSVQEADRDRLDAFAFERLAGIRHTLLLQGLVDLASGQHALVDLTGQAARHKRPMAMEEQVVGFGPVAAADDVDVAGAARHDEAGLGAFALDQRVDGRGRAVDQFVDGGGINAALTNAVDHALGKLRRRGQALGLDKGLGLIVKTDQVGEGAADVNRNENHATAPAFNACMALLWS